MVYGCGVKADRMRIVIILVPSISPVNHTNVCVVSRFGPVVRR